MDLIYKAYFKLDKYGEKYLQLEFEKLYPTESKEVIAQSISKAAELRKAVEESNHLYDIPYKDIHHEALEYLKSKVPNLDGKTYQAALNSLMRRYLY